MAHWRQDLQKKTTMATPGKASYEPPRRFASFQERYTPTPGHGPTPESSRDNYVDDPFSHLRNKEKGDELITLTIDQFFIQDAQAAQQSSLDLDQCRNLCLRAYDKLRANNVKCEEYTETNFETSFSIYQNKRTEQIEMKKLKNFVKCLAEL